MIPCLKEVYVLDRVKIKKKYPVSNLFEGYSGPVGYRQPLIFTGKTSAGPAGGFVFKTMFHDSSTLEINLSKETFNSFMEKDIFEIAQKEEKIKFLLNM